jgi:hypothetical protein
VISGTLAASGSGRARRRARGEAVIDMGSFRGAERGEGGHPRVTAGHGASRHLNGA